MQSITITVGGHSFQIRSDAEADHVVSLAAEINRRYDGIGKKGPRASQEFRAMAMVAVMVLDEMEDLKTQCSKLKSRIGRVEDDLKTKDAEFDRLQGDLDEETARVDREKQISSESLVHEQELRRTAEERLASIVSQRDEIKENARGFSRRIISLIDELLSQNQV